MIYNVVLISALQQSDSYIYIYIYSFHSLSIMVYHGVLNIFNNFPCYRVRPCCLLLFSCSAMSNSLRLHGLQHARLPCPSLSPGVCSNSHPLSLMPSSHLILCRPLLLLPSIFPSIRVFSNESALRISWPEYWNFTFSISLSSEYLGLISFKID